jgi:hypothetical protein
MDLKSTAIKSVTPYTAAPVETCDRCGTGIKYVFAVTYRDGETLKYGSECIKKILDHAPDMLKLFNANAKKLATFKRGYAILSGPVGDMPRGREYYGSGMYFVGDGQGEDVFFKHWFFHPIMDTDKNQSGSRYVQDDPDGFEAKRLKEIAADLPAMKAEIERLELFLAKVMRCAAAKAPAAA